MSSEQMRQALDTYFAGIRSMNAEQYVAAFADDAVVEDPVGTPPLENHDARRQFYAGIASLFRNLSLDPDHLYVNGNQAAVKWTGRGTTKGGKPVQFDGIDVVTINDAGEIQRVMAYWDTGAMMAQIEG